mmetsp:Transcript_43687/g.103217  ORF Transcript_43687/g.103217 Transcript_43687/m.103217 type:complete len:314 (+) Transcript_43687:172-1113(+)|eukprot:CAMPEP_0177706710 /NCGR_PEP_ID=MMETSP0484_2-20121128/9368_1 /TAXON_ID=354590 /ORGANISM="Rhodomonas lens, Strain RHODO" /LENGTH=313 /DNA_ID=CAMNT_0019218185 /DNA_START=172 /DNA_END=1113 /DNA_ORIENTATION=-
MDEEEKAILEEEREAVIVESWRFLDEHAMECKRHSAALLEEIAQQLRCVKHEKDDKGEVTVVDKAAMVFLESEERAVVGSLRLSECHVQDFDLSIRFPRYNKGASAHYTIAPKTSYLLRQIQDAVHLIERAEDLIRQLPGPQTRSSAENGAAAHGNADGGLKNPAEQLLRVAKMCAEVLRLLHEAQTTLEDWSTRALPSMPQNWVRMKPPLPPDLILQVYADADALVLRVCLLAKHPRMPPGKHQACAGDTCDRLKGRLMPYKGAWIEVVDAAEARCPLKGFSLAISNLALVRQSVRDLMHNAEAMDYALASA